MCRGWHKWGGKWSQSCWRDLSEERHPSYTHIESHDPTWRFNDNDSQQLGLLEELTGLCYVPPHKEEPEPSANIKERKAKKEVAVGTTGLFPEKPKPSNRKVPSKPVKRTPEEREEHLAKYHESRFLRIIGKRKKGRPPKHPDGIEEPLYDEFTDRIGRSWYLPNLG